MENETHEINLEEEDIVNNVQDNQTNIMETELPTYMENDNIYSENNVD